MIAFLVLLFERFRSDKCRLRGPKTVKMSNPLVVAPDRQDGQDGHTDAQAFLDSYTIGPSGKQNRIKKKNRVPIFVKQK